MGSPSKQPSKQPIILPSLQPQIIPSSEPSLEPSILPSSDPSTTPSCQPTNPPTLLPLQRPSTFPSVEPSDLPTIQPHAIPSFEPSIGPTLKPSDLPTMLPSLLPSSEPSGLPSLFPSARSFFMSPTNQPSYQPLCTPTNVPIKFPVCSPSIYPSLQQSAYSISTCKPSSNSPSTMEASPLPLRSTFSPTNITVPSLFPSAVILVPILQTQTQTQMPITSSPTQEPTLLASQSQSQSPFANAVNSVSLNQVLITAQSLYSSLASNCSHNTYCSYFEEVLFDGGIKLGGDSAFTEYLESELKNLQLQSSVNSIAFFRQSSFSPMDKFSTTRCLDANVARKIVSRMINYYDYVKDKTPTVYICAGDNWILQSCGAKNDLKLCINCFDPCTAVSVNPSAVFPFMGLSSSWVGILQVGFEDYDLPARVLFVKPSYISEQQISINISLSDFSYVYCMAVQGLSPINPSVQVLLSHPSQIAVNNMATYSFYNLIPSTSYSIYCITQSQISRVLPSEDMFQTVVRTDCCKKVHVSVTTPYTASQVLYFGILQVKFSAAPAVSVSLQADFLGQPTIKSCNFSTLFITNTSFTSADHPYLVSLQCSRPLMVGNYFISIFLDGYSASEYILNGDDDLAVSVISKNFSVSVPPSFFSATFDNSGTSLIIQFTSATNKALLPDIFACRDLLLFSNVDRSKCRWLDGATIKVQLIGGLAPTVGSFIFVSKSEHVMKLIAACPVHHDCSKWKSILDDSRVQILGPKNPIQPIVVAIGPAEIDICSSVVIDLSPSSGSAGRQWLNFTVTVSSLSTDGSLSGLLSTVERIASDSAYNNSYLAVQLPAGLLYAITTYSFHFVACNWMQRCSGATYFITKYNRSTSVPTTSIAGPTVRYINVYNDLILNAIVHANPCADSTVTQISWKILLAGIELDVINHSNESSKFYLPGYSLKMNSQYLVRLVVTIPLTFEVFTYTVQVIVNARTYADVVPIIQQGSAISLSAGQSIFLNGNLSFDRTLSPKFQSKDTSLVFSWSCNALSSNVSNSCNFLAILPGKNGSHFSSVLVTANSAAIGSIFSVTMTILKGAISNQASIKLHIVQFLDNSCTVEINPLKFGGSNVFIGQKLKLISGGAATSSKNLSWSVTNLDVNAISAGATSRLFQVSKANSILQPFNFDLSVLANSFSFGITYTFTLSCISLNSDSSEIVPYASIDIFPNQPPIPGIFIVFPQSGVELIDMFGLYALYWYSEHIPLYYQFGFISPGTGFCLEAQHKSEVSYAFKAFPSGHPSKSYLLRITLDVFDSIGSNYSIFNDTTVLPSQQSLLTISSAISALNKSLDGPHETMYKLSMYSTRFNRANCSISPNCSLLNRQSCLNTDYTCGPCLVSFTGQSGDSNTKCTQTISSRRKLLSDANSSFCRNDNDCDAFQQCIEGVCVNSQQDCPNMCSQHGNCSFVLTKTGLPTKTCTYYDTSCTSICSCAYGYSGVACAQTSVQLAASIRIRCSMVRSLWISIQRSNVDGDSISNWINLVNSLSFNAGEISACKFTVYEILQYIINYSLIVHMPYESMQLLSQTFDRLLTFTDMYLETIALIEKWSTTISSDMVVSQSVQSIEQHFRILTISSVTKKEQIILEPVHGNETPTNFAVLNTLPSNVDDWITYTMIESQAALIESFEVNSNQITLIPNSFSSTVPFKVTISLANNNAVNDTKIFQSSNFSTACEANEVTNHTYSCPVGPSTITARCSGTESIIHSYCPAYRYSTFCESITPTSGGVHSCRKVNPASVDRTICECLIYNDSSHLKFHISLAAGLRTELLYIPPTITIIKGPESQPYNIISATLIAVILVIFSVLGFFIRNKKSISKFISKVEPAVEVHSLHWRDEPMWNDMELLLAYGERSYSLKNLIASAIPPMYKCSSMLHRLSMEFKSKSKYASLIYGQEQLRSCIVIVTSWNVTIFFLSVFIAGLSDTERCKSFHLSSSCERALSRVDRSSHACQWNSASHSCEAISFSISGHNLFFVTCLLVLWSLLLAIPVIVFLQQFLIDKKFSAIRNPRVAPHENDLVSSDEITVSDGDYRHNNVSANSTQTFDGFVRKSQHSMSNFEAEKMIRNLNRFFTKYHAYKGYAQNEHSIDGKGLRKEFAKSKFSVGDFSSVLQGIADKVSHELKIVNSKSPHDKGVYLFHLLFEDLLPMLSASIFSNKLSRDEIAISPLRLGWVKVAVLALVNIACFVTFSILVTVESYDEQHVLLYSLLLWIFVDCVLIDLLYILTVEVILPSIATRDLSTVIDTIQTAAVEPCVSAVAIRIRNKNKASVSPVLSNTNFAPLFMPSVKLALQLPHLREARIISYFDTELSAFKGIFQCSGIGDTNGNWWKQFKRMLESSLMYFYGFNPHIQEILMRMVISVLSIAYVAVYNALFNVSVALILIPMALSLFCLYVVSSAPCEAVKIDIHSDNEFHDIMDDSSTDIQSGTSWIENFSPLLDIMSTVAKIEEREAVGVVATTEMNQPSSVLSRRSQILHSQILARRVRPSSQKVRATSLDEIKEGSEDVDSLDDDGDEVEEEDYDDDEDDDEEDDDDEDGDNYTRSSGEDEEEVDKEEKSDQQHSSIQIVISDSNSTIGKDSPLPEAKFSSSIQSVSSLSLATASNFPLLKQDHSNSALSSSGRKSKKISLIGALSPRPQLKKTFIVRSKPDLVRETLIQAKLEDVSTRLSEDRSVESPPAMISVGSGIDFGFDPGMQSNLINDKPLIVSSMYDEHVLEKKALEDLVDAAADVNGSEKEGVNTSPVIANNAPSNALHSIDGNEVVHRPVSSTAVDNNYSSVAQQRQKLSSPAWVRPSTTAVWRDRPISRKDIRRASNALFDTSPIMLVPRVGSPTRSTQRRTALLSAPSISFAADTILSLPVMPVQLRRTSTAAIRKVKREEEPTIGAEIAFSAIDEYRNNSRNSHPPQSSEEQSPVDEQAKESNLQQDQFMKVDQLVVLDLDHEEDDLSL